MKIHKKEINKKLRLPNQTVHDTLCGEDSLRTFVFDAVTCEKCREIYLNRYKEIYLSDP